MKEQKDHATGFIISAYPLSLIAAEQKPLITMLVYSLVRPGGASMRVLCRFIVGFSDSLEMNAQSLRAGPFVRSAHLHMRPRIRVLSRDPHRSFTRPAHILVSISHSGPPKESRNLLIMSRAPAPDCDLIAAF